MRRAALLVLFGCGHSDEAHIDGVEPSGAIDSDPPTTSLWAQRRLSNLELERSAADALGVDVPTGPWLPPDPVVDGLTHLRGDSTLTASFIDDLEVWARDVAQEVTHPTSPQAAPLMLSLQAEELPWTSGVRSAVELQPFTVYWIVGDEASAELEVPQDDVWSLHLELMARVKVNTPTTVAFEVDGQPIGEVTLSGERVDQVAGELDATVELTAGVHVLTVLPDFTRSTPLPAAIPGEDYFWDPEPFVGLDAVQLTGAQDAPVQAYARDTLACPDASPETVTCAQQVLARVLPTLWRRPVSDDEVARLVDVFQTSRDDGLSWADAVGEALVAALLSPSFTLHLDGPSNAVTADGAPLAPFVVANRLAYALWQSGPDEALLACATEGGLDTDDDGPCGLLPQARRLLADPRAEVLVDEFALRWLGVRDLDDLWFINRQYPRYTPGLLKDEQAETAALFRELWKDDRDLRELLTADHTWANHRVADLYGVASPTQVDLTWTSLDGTGRTGVLGQAAILTATAKGSDPTSVDRATWVLGNLLCRPLPSPPANVPPLPPGDTPITDRFEAHVSDPSCASCHSGIDPYGLPLSRFDAMGELRADGSGAEPTVLPDGTRVDSLAAYATWLASQDEFARCAVRRVLTWVQAKDHLTGDDAHVAELTTAALSKGFTFQAILETVLADPDFRTHEVSP